MGTVDYGTFEDSTHDSTFTKKFDHETFTKYLFATGDLVHWGIIVKEAVQYTNTITDWSSVSGQSVSWISSSDDTTALTWPYFGESTAPLITLHGVSSSTWLTTVFYYEGSSGTS